jgi:hypothetical protein
VGKGTSFKEALKKADEVILHATQGISDLIRVTGEVNVDFADVRTVMASRGPALMGTGAGDIDIVVNCDLAKWPTAFGKRVTCRGQPRAGHAETGVGVCGFGNVDPGPGKHLARTIVDRAIGRLSTFKLKVGTAVDRFGKGVEVCIGETHAAIGATTVDSEIVFRQGQLLLLRARSMVWD